MSAGNSPTCSLLLSAATTSLSATFRPLYTLTITPSGSGTVTSAPAGITCGADCTETYVTGTSVTLTAEPAPGYEVYAWTGTGTVCNPSQRTCTVTMTQARLVGVEFRLLRTLGVTVNGTGTGTITGSGISCASGGTGTCAVQVFDGTSVTLTETVGGAAAGTRHLFTTWGGDCTTAGTATTCTFTMNAAKAVTATFTRQWQLTLIIQTIGGAAGSLAATPGTFTCASGSCQQYFDAGTNLSVTATPATGTDVLQGVTGACTASPCSVTMDAAKNVTATFQPTPGDLSLVAPASGSLDFGLVTYGAPSAADQTITIRNSGGSTTGALATSLTGAGATSFSIITDACNGATLAANATCNVTVRFTPQAVGALAAIVSVRDTVSSTVRSVTVAGTGQGSVTVNKVGGGSVASTPAGLSCNSACGTATATFSTSPITLTATADPGWAFSTWAGACASAGTATTCTLPLGAASTTVSATFVRIYTLSVAITGTGSVTSAPTGISCGADCTETYTTGTSVTLTAEPSAGWEVYAWTGTGGACAAGQRTCTTAMTLDRNVAVEFRRQFTLSVSLGGAGSGTVSGTGGISCAAGGTGTCSATIFDGASVTLTQAAASAPAGSQYVFTGWSGACTGTAGCSFVMDAAKSVTASYKVQHRLSFTIDSISMAQGSLTAAPGGFSCTTGTCTSFYDAGTALTVTAAATRAGIDALQAVTGDCSGTPCSLTMNAPKNVTATVSPTAGSLVVDVPAGGAGLSYGTVAIGAGGSSTPSTITIRNSGGSPSGTLTTTLSGAGSASYSIVTNGCNGMVLASNGTCSVTVRFNPAAAGSQTANLAIGDGVSSVSVGLTGTGSGSVTVNKTGSGTISSSPIGISCGSGCSTQTASFSSTPVVLTATPDAGYVFSAWTGACTGTSSTCSVPITAASATVGATFVQVWTLSVSVTGSGVVTAAPTGITCGNGNNDCTETYNTGTNVTLTATPDAGYDVAVWTGTVTSCPAMQRTCVVPMTAARSVTVEFRPIPTVPQLAKPLNGAYVGSALVAGTRRPKFVWRAATVAGGGAITYDLQYSSDQTFASGVTTVSALTLTDHQPTGDLPVNTSGAPKGTRYYWRVRACSQLVCSAYPTRYMVNVARSDHDFNGDGYADVVVVRNGKISVFFGPSLSAGGALHITYTGTGFAIAVGDFNGDGFADLAQGTRADSTTGSAAGRVSLYYGGATFNSVADFNVYGFAAGDWMGDSVAAGDFNSDGYDDLVVGSPNTSPSGRTDVFMGSANPDATADRTYLGVDTTNQFGVGAIAADVDGNGYADLLVARRDLSFGIYVYTYDVMPGGAGGIGASATQALTGGGLSQLARVGDVNGDGFEDAYGAVAYCSFAGCSYGASIATGSASGLGAFTSFPTPPGYSGSNFGYNYGSFGDVNRDGYDDLAIGDYSATGGQFWVYLGASTIDTNADASFTGAGNAASSLCGGGDVNGDGVGDFADGAVGETGLAATSGRAHVFYGASGSGVNVVADIILNGDAANEGFGKGCSL